jgi:ABC-type oligopeptide transport system substrate-binding subunit
VDEVLFKIFPDPDTSYLQWQAGNLDWTRLPPAKIPEAKAQNPGNYIIQDVGGINYLVVRYTLAPTSNKLFDQAISMSFDRQAISNAVFSGLNTPAAGIVPPLIPGSRSKGTSGPCKYCSYDPAKAQALFKQFKDGGGTVKEPFPMYFNAGAGHDAWMQAIANQIQTTLGFKVQAIAATSQFTGAESYSKFIGKDAPASANRLGWSLDYPTPDNFLYPLFSTGSPDNKAQYSNPTFDALIKQARAEPNADKRVKLYQQAEDIVLEDLPIIPVWWRTQIRLVKLNKWGGLGMDPYEDPTVRTVYLKAASS